MLSFITNSFGDRYLHEVSGNSFNKFGANKVISEGLGKLILEEEFLYIIIGTDSGILPNYLIEKGIPQGSEYIFIETDELFPTIQSAFPNHPQLHLRQQSNWTELAKNLKLTLHIQANCAGIINSLSIRNGRHKAYSDLATNFKREFDTIANEALNLANVFGFFEIGLKNLADNQFSISSLIHDHSNDTAIILGAGPSLDEHIDWIRQHQNNLYIFAVSRVSQKLLKEDITPDYIISVDYQEFSYYSGKEAFQFENHSTLIHAFHANPQLVGQWLGKKVFTGDRFPWATSLNKDCINQNGTTVSNIAYDAATTLGFGQILLAGVDFCHDSSGFTHATESGSEGRRVPELYRSETFVLNNRNETVESTHEFKKAGNDLSKFAGNAEKRKNIKTINISSSALQMEHIDFKDKTELTLPSSQKQIPEKITPSPRSYYKSCIQELNRARTKLKELSLSAQKAIKKYHSLFDKDGIKNLKIEKQIDKIEKLLNNNNNPFIPLLKLIGLRKNLKVLRATRSDNHEWSHTEVTRSKVEYFSEFKKNCDTLLEIINDSISRIHSRTKEISPQKEDLTSLLDQWINDKTPRRLQQEKIELLSSQNTTDESKLIKTLHTINNEMNTPPKKNDITFRENLYGAGASIRNYLEKSDLNSLKFLHNKLLNQPETDEKGSYISLCLGAIAYLEGDYSESFTRLTNLLGIADHFNEDELEFILSKVSMTAIKLKDYANATAALETLSQTFSPIYTPKYAELLYLTGDTDKSLEMYETYFKQSPDDLDAVFSLAELLRKEKQIENAKGLYQFILSKNPEYTPAAHRLAEP